MRYQTVKVAVTLSQHVVPCGCVPGTNSIYKYIYTKMELTLISNEVNSNALVYSISDFDTRS